MIEGRLLRRYKRFLADVILSDGTIVTAHCPNSGSMRTCTGENWPVLMTADFENKKRKYPFTLEMISNGKTWIGVHTGKTNSIVASALIEDKIDRLTGYREITREVTRGDSRLDFLLRSPRRKDCFVEVKSVTLVEDGVYMFPDSVTVRGKKHLEKLIQLKEEGNRAVNLFVVQRSDGTYFSPADHIDPEYGKMLREAKKRGVELLVYGTQISPPDIEISGAIQLRL